MKLFEVFFVWHLDNVVIKSHRSWRIRLGKRRRRKMLSSGPEGVIALEGLIKAMFLVVLPGLGAILIWLRRQDLARFFSRRR